jgi:hypothetical protein
VRNITRAVKKNLQLELQDTEKRNEITEETKMWKYLPCSQIFKMILWCPEAGREGMEGAPNNVSTYE